MNILELLKSIEFSGVDWPGDNTCPKCKEETTHDNDCELKAAIDALECGKIQVIHTPNYTSEFIATIEGINENIKRKPKEIESNG